MNDVTTNNTHDATEPMGKQSEYRVVLQKDTSSRQLYKPIYPETLVHNPQPIQPGHGSNETHPWWVSHQQSDGGFCSDVSGHNRDNCPRRQLRRRHSVLAVLASSRGGGRTRACGAVLGTAAAAAAARLRRHGTMPMVAPRNETKPSKRYFSFTGTEIEPRSNHSLRTILSVKNPRSGGRKSLPPTARTTKCSVESFPS